MKNAVILLLLTAVLAILVADRWGVRAHAQAPAVAPTDWFCTETSPNALGASSNVCFQLTTVEMVVPLYRELYFNSSNSLHISDPDWTRLCRFAADRGVWNGVQ
jgi:hypothetical protein